MAYPLAACSPKPLEPPVTTATLPSREKMDWKLSSWTCSAADMFAMMGLRMMERLSRERKSRVGESNPVS